MADRLDEFPPAETEKRAAHRPLMDRFSSQTHIDHKTPDFISICLQSIIHLKNIYPKFKVCSSHR